MSAAADFLTSLPGPLVDLTAIHPDGRIIGRSFSKGNTDDRAALVKAIATATAKGYGIYFNINALGVRLGIDERDGKKIMEANEANVTMLHALHVDADVDKTVTNPAAFAKAKADLLASIQSMNKPPTIIVDSGNGFGLFWLLRKPVKVTDKNRADLKARNIMLRDAVRALPGGSADACENLDRVMRVPFTTNYPNAAKLKRGRVEVPTGLVLDDRKRLYDVEDFESTPVVETPSPPTVPADDLDIPDTVDLSRLDPDFRKLIEKGPTQPKWGSRSEYVFFVVCKLIESAFTDGEIVAVIINPDFKVSEHVLDQKQRTPEATATRIIREAHKRGAVVKQSGTTAEEDFGADEAEEAAALDKIIEWWKLRDQIQRQEKYDHRDFLLYLPGADKTKFIFTPTGSEEFWSASSVNLKCKPQPMIDPRKASKTPDECEKIDGTRDHWLRKVDEQGKIVLDKDGKPKIAYQSAADWIKDNPKQHIAVVTWWPGKPAVIHDTMVFKEGGVIPKKGCTRSTAIGRRASPSTRPAMRRCGSITLS